MDNAEQARRLRHELGLHRGQHQYPEVVAARVIDHVRISRAQGHTMAELAKGLGLPLDTLYRWRRSRAVSLVPVTIVPEVLVPSSTLTVRGPRGLFVEGLTLPQVADLWRSLA